MDARSYREEVYGTLTGTGALPERIDEALDVGREYLGLPYGFFTDIGNGTQRVVRASGGHEKLQPGESCPLDDAYCQRTVEQDGALAIQNAARSDAVPERAVEAFELGTYIGAKVVADGEVHGTVCFAADERRAETFSDAEEMFVELLAELIGQAFERQSFERELQRRNDRLEREKQRFEGIAESSSDVIFRVGVEGRITYVSSAVEDVLGRSTESLVGSPFDDVVDAASVERAVSAYGRVMEGESVEGVELDFVDTDGERVPLEVNAVPITDDGTVTGLQGVGRDVTGRKERERELRLKNHAIDEAELGVSIADADQSDYPLVYVNGGFERTTGYSATEAIGRNCRFLQGERTDPSAIAELRAALAAEEPTSVELVNYRKDGTPFWNRLRLSPVENDAGTVTHYLGFQGDVTERKRTEGLVRLLNRALRHNLRNEMNVVMGLGKRLQRGDVDDVTAAGERMAETAGRLVDLSEQARQLKQTGQRERRPERLDTDRLLDDIRATARERWPDASVEVTNGAARPVCAGRELETALEELVVNALKHNPGPEPRVEIAAVDTGEWVEITVTDDGPGIDGMESAVVERGAETAVEHGAGLGLWLVNWIVTRYGGSFGIEGGDEGSVATVRLPGIDSDESVEAVERGPTALFR